MCVCVCVRVCVCVEGFGGGGAAPLVMTSNPMLETGEIRILTNL